jgi:hypothetical protein
MSIRWGFRRGVERGVERWREIVAPFSRKSRIAERDLDELREALQVDAENVDRRTTSSIDPRIAIMLDELVSANQVDAKRNLEELRIAEARG